MKRPIRIVAILLTFAMVLALCACGGSNVNAPPKDSQKSTEQPKSSDTPKYGGVYRTTVNVSPNTLFAIYRSPGFGAIYQPAVETLGRTDLKTNMVTPFLAKSFDFDTKNFAVTIKLNEGIKFHDGSEFTSEVVKWNLEFAMKNKLGGSFYNPIGLDCPDKYTIVVKYSAFYIDAPSRLGRCAMYSKKAFDEHGADWCNFNPVGTGPYKFKEYVVDSRISYVRNENYWMKGKPYLDGVDVRIIFDNTAAMTAFANKELSSYTIQDMAANNTLQAMGFKDKGQPVWGGYYLNTLAVGSKFPDDPWSKVKVRQAVLLHGLDYAQLGKLSLGKYAIANPQLCLPGSLVYDERITKAVTYDPDMAKKMLSEAGYPDGFKTDIYSLLNTISLATAMQDALKKLNITANVVEISNTDPRRTDGSFRGIVILGGATTWDPIPNPVGTMFHPKTPTYGANIAYSKEYARLFDLATGAGNYEERTKYGKELMYLAHVEECLYINAVWQVPCVYIQDNLRDSNLENRAVQYENMWFSAK